MDTKTTEFNKIVVGIGAVCVQNGNAEMVAYALGSCVALCLYDELTGIGAMAHILLPSASVFGYENTHIDLKTKYADHALSSALDMMYALGAKKEGIRSGIAGGAEMFPRGSVRAMNIGEMNVRSVTQELYKRGIPLVYSNTGGKKARTVTFTIPVENLAELLRVRSAYPIHISSRL